MPRLYNNTSNNNSNSNNISSGVNGGVAIYYGGSGGVGISGESLKLYRIHHGDADANGIVDIKDFNLLMINWGKKSPNNSSDFNRDGKVDIFDFNILMVNWGKKI